MIYGKHRNISHDLSNLIDFIVTSAYPVYKLIIVNETISPLQFLLYVLKERFNGWGSENRCIVRNETSLKQIFAFCWSGDLKL